MGEGRAKAAERRGSSIPVQHTQPAQQSYMFSSRSSYVRYCQWCIVAHCECVHISDLHPYEACITTACLPYRHGASPGRLQQQVSVLASQWRSNVLWHGQFFQMSASSPGRLSSAQVHVGTRDVRGGQASAFDIMHELIESELGMFERNWVHRAGNSFLHPQSLFDSPFYRGTAHPRRSGAVHGVQEQGRHVSPPLEVQQALPPSKVLNKAQLNYHMCGTLCADVPHECKYNVLIEISAFTCIAVYVTGASTFSECPIQIREQ